MTTDNQESLEPPGALRDPPRRVMLASVAATAALAGVGLAWWRAQTSDAPPQTPVDGLWAMKWDTPAGTVLAMESFRGKPLLLNFWATWCPPCVEELPLINAFYRENKDKNWQVLALAVDGLTPVQAFLQRMPLDFPIGMAGMAGAELGRGLGNLTGSLPFTVVLGASGQVLHRKLGRLKSADLDAWLRLK
jgi:thiol-disulfide isomerase/thioredoxin